MISSLDIAWLGGLLEGEGSFYDSKGSPCIALQTTDRDVLLRVADLLGVKEEGKGWKPKGKPTYKQVYMCRVHGFRAIGWMMTLFQFFGERRQDRIGGIIERWKAAKASARAPRNKPRHMALCHPDRVKATALLCHPCYMREWRQRTGRNGTYYRSQKAKERET